MLYEWDRQKAGRNLREHRIAFSDATSVFADGLALTRSDEHASEDRFVTGGMDLFGRVLVVAYTWRGETIRIISAREATPRERKQYEG